MNRFEKVMSLRRAGGVRRWHTMQTLRSQDLAAHSHAVAMLAIEVHPGPVSVALLTAALVHDLPEHRTGDLPATIKWESPALIEELTRLEAQWYEDHGIDTSALTEVDKAVLHFCDSFELMLWAIEESELGNRGMKEVMIRIAGRIRSRGFPSTVAEDIFTEASRQACV